MKKLVIKYKGKNKDIKIENYLKDFDFGYIRDRKHGKYKIGQFIVRLK